MPRLSLFRSRVAPRASTLLTEFRSHRSGTARTLGRLAPIFLFASGCHLVLSPTGEEETNADEAGIEARECGDQTCSEGNVCCNPSCGICTAPGNVCIQIACESAEPDTTCMTVLCGPKDVCMETPAGAVCVPEAESPCNLVDCQPNSTCKVEQGAPVCVPLNGSGDAGAPVVKDAGTAAPKDGGAAADDAGQPKTDAGSTPALDAGTPKLDASTPVEDAGAPKLDAGPKKDSGVSLPITCATVLCPTGTYCDDISGAPECLPLPSCNTVKCSAGYHCELEQVVCVRAPCPPLPMCVPDSDPSDPCGALKCKVGTHCQLTPITCITTPCNPIAQCVPDKGGCGCSGKGACLDIICPVGDPAY